MFLASRIIRPAITKSGKRCFLADFTPEVSLPQHSVSSVPNEISVPIEISVPKEISVHKELYVLDESLRDKLSYSNTYYNISDTNYLGLPIQGDYISFSEINNTPIEYYGDWITEILLQDNPFVIVDGNGFRTLNYYIGKCYSLRNPATYQKLDLKVPRRILIDACTIGDIEILDCWLAYRTRHNLTKSFPELAITEACRNGHVAVLQWLKKPGTSVEFNLTNWQADEASKYGHINILNWLIDSGLEFQYSQFAILYAVQNGQLATLKWWVQQHTHRGIQLKYPDYCIMHAAFNGHVQIFKWWLNSGLIFTFNNNFADYVSGNGHLAVLELLKDLNLLKYSKLAIDWACDNGHLHILKWWFRQYAQFGFELLYSEHAIDFASRNNQVKILEFWLKTWLKGDIDQLKYTSQAMDSASRNGNIDVLDFWLNAHYVHGIELKYTEQIYDGFENYPTVRIWWNTSGLLKKKYCNPNTVRE